MGGTSQMKEINISQARMDYLKKEKRNNIIVWIFRVSILVLYYYGKFLQ